MCFSPQGDKLLLVTLTGLVDLFNFDRCTGVLSNWTPLGAPANNIIGPNTFYGCSFSPDGSKIYVSEEGNPQGSRLFQWDITAVDVQASKTQIHTAPDSVEFGQHQLGPDGKIYIAHYAYPFNPNNPNNYYLSVIGSPALSGASCNFTYNGLHLLGRSSTLGLPNLPNFDLPPLVAQVAEAGPPRLVCAGDSVRIGYPDSTGGAVGYHWSPANAVGDSTSAYTWAHPVATTWYYLTAMDSAVGIPCGVTMDSVLVVVADSADFPVADAGRDTSLCRLDSLGIGGPGQGWTYSWSPTLGLGHPDSSWTDVALPGRYVLEARNPAGTGACLLDRDTMQVDTFVWNPLPPGFAGPDTVLCLGDSISLGWGVEGWIWDWTPGGGLADSSFGGSMASPLQTTVYVVEALDSASGGMCQAALDTVRVTVEEPFVHPVPESKAFCPGEAVEIGVAAQEGFTYTWVPIEWLQDPHEPLTLANPPGGMVYTLVVQGDTFRTPECREQRFTVAMTTGGCVLQNALSPNGDGVNDVLDLGSFAVAPRLEVYDRWGALVYASDAYQNDWDGGNSPDGVYWYVVSGSGPLGPVVVALTVLR